MGEVFYKEVTPYPEISERWKDITINAGASQSTLQDIKLPETAGCFTYKESGLLSSPASNRFIYWRTSNDVLELVEISLDINLRGNHIRLRFQHTPVLEGVSIHETRDQVVVLVATVSTVHKLLFPHPHKLQSKDYMLRQTHIILPSIFFDASLANLRDQSSYFVLNHASAGIPLPHTSCSWLTQDGDAAFVLANSVGSLSLVVLSEGDGGKIATTELRRMSVMSRLWSGLVPSVIRGSQGGEDVALSIVCQQEESDFLIFSLCRDLRIRMWSYNRQECLMVSSVLEYYGESGNTSSWNVTAQQCCLRKTLDTAESNFYLGVYISLPDQNQFCIFQPLYVTDQYRLSHIATLYGPQHDLVDFCLTMSHLWTLWLNSQSEPVIKMTTIESDGQSMPHNGWISVDLERPVPRDVYIPFGELDPREAYLKEIFQQGRFSPSTISKAISIYRRMVDTSFSAEFSVALETLKDEVVMVVESEVQTKASESELNDEEYLELQIECWDRFFSYCIQYHEVGTKPLGLSLDPYTGCLIVIKKNIYSLLRPCDAVEQLILSDIHLCSPSLFSSNAIVSEDSSLCSNMVAILQSVDTIHKHLNEDMLVSFEHDMFHLQSPEEIALELSRDLSILPSDAHGALLMKLQIYLQTASSLVQAFHQFLRWLDIGQKQDVCENNEYDPPHYAVFQHFLCSSSGISVVCEGIRQFARQRFSFCRDLLLLEMLIIQLGEKCCVTLEKSEKIRSEIVPVTCSFVRAYYSVMWCTECVCIPVQPAVLESGLRQLSLLDIPESITSPKTKIGTALGSTIVHLFLSEQGGIQARHHLVLQHSSERHLGNCWTLLLPSLISSAAQLLWPLGPNFLFPEFLFTQCQYLPLQGYVRLLQKWCEWNSCSRQFLSASSLLTLGEHQKAQDLFCQAAEGVEKEEFLRTKIMQGIDNTTASITAQFYLKVIQLFEYFGLSDSIISLASTAIGIVEKGDPSIPVFWSLVFKHHLELGHSEEAYIAMTRNPDNSRQKDCLRQLIVVLCERRQLRTLVEFPYLHIQGDVVNILESRARSSDLLRQNYYDLLYAFHMHTSNFRKAATVTFEYGMRLSQEVCSLAGLQKQASCYLATINSLHLVDSTYAWIVKPIPKSPDMNDDDDCSVNMSPKRNSDGEEIQNTATTQKVEVLELNDIRREYDLIHARLLLVQRDPSPGNIAATPLSPSDTVTLLVNAGLFDVAVRLCVAFSLPFTSVFEGLACRCANLMQQSKNQWGKEDELDIWDWLGQNDTSVLPSSGYISGQEQVWYLLKCYLEQYEEVGQTVFHRCVSSKLLSAGMQLPAWLKRSYQKYNCAELLWLYISYGLLENATDLALDYIDAVLGNGKEDFGIKLALHVNAPPVWLPHTYLDALLEALEELQKDSNCRMYYKNLTEKISKYNQNVESVSETMIAMPRQEKMVSS